MAFIKVENIKISGLAACVPKEVEENSEFHLFDHEAYKGFAAATGVERKRKSAPGVITSDLCVAAAEKLIVDLNWNKEEINFLVFVSQSGDYYIPSTSPIIQDRMGLSIDCFSLDISLGCSGWVYGMSVISSLMSVYKKGKGLLLMGDTPTKGGSPDDKSTYPLFGDAGTATALEYIEHAEPLLFGMNSDGSGHKAIMVRDSSYSGRNPGSKSSYDPVVYGEGIVHNNFQLTLDGMDVFSFGIKRAPQSVNKLIEEFHLEKDNIDYFLFHQANLMMNEQIRKKLKLPAEKVPYSLKDFGNTSSASIPLTMVTQLKNELETKPLHQIACGFGVGLSWGSVFFNTDKIVVLPLVEV
jgi:3-oxoacyl-[acyl-carrier-protein] synthase-3